MTTHHYEVAWPDGSAEIAASEAPTVDAYAMERWGYATAEEVKAAHGVVIVEAADPSLEK